MRTIFRLWRMSRNDLRLLWQALLPSKQSRDDRVVSVQ
jgi:hypothetical protein